MAPVYADHPFTLIPTPVFLLKSANPDAKTDKFDEIASEMANVHNMFVRGLNSIYLQAPHIVPSDEKHFANYILAFHNFLHIHHHGEETQFFPEVEAMAGIPGLMEGNVEQHHAFHDGLAAFKQYAEDVVAGKERYDGGKVRGIIDSFGSALMEHLADEIPTLVGLRRYEDKMGGLEGAIKEEAETSMKKLGLMGLVPCFANLDVHYENDMWINWPPAPGPVKFLVKTVLWWVMRDVRKFGAVDRTGTMQPLYAIPAETKTQG
ncbi:hemerythrin HHE cation binding domain-containing protein [Podospora australis]|uniref:Hemerythrin HHE cation binding domain-containing protein n=1 Tax=Podospora australis TaxID=1536484 RepID=A0AAN6WM15_9PEZI|nr:hemerythrin HHE cation binding domain-containing protein [Podospora australis]